MLDKMHGPHKMIGIVFEECQAQGLLACRLRSKLHGICC